MMSNKIKAEFESWRVKNIERIENAMERSMARLEKNQPPAIAGLVAAMRYSLLGGGKRVRPLLALAAAEAVGGQAREALPAAQAVEMIHAYSLIHDDLPAMDNDDLRRGRPTCHKKFGEATALLAGDALLTLAFETFAQCGSKSLESARRINTAAVHLAKAVGAVGMVGGQAMDLSFERQSDGLSGPGKIQAHMVRDMELRKTGELMAVALVCGAVLGGGTPGDLKLLRKIGLKLGAAFQIKDDLLNLQGDPKLLGKAVGSDAERGKASFPSVFGLEAAERELADLSVRAVKAASSFKIKGLRLVQLIESLVDRQN